MATKTSEPLPAGTNGIAFSLQAALSPKSGMGYDLSPPSEEKCDGDWLLSGGLSQCGSESGWELVSSGSFTGWLHGLIRERWPSPRENAANSRDGSPHAQMEWISPLSPSWADVSRPKSRSEQQRRRPPVHRPPRSKLPSPALRACRILVPNRVGANGPPRPPGREAGRKSLRGTNSQRRVHLNPTPLLRPGS